MAARRGQLIGNFTSELAQLKTMVRVDGSLPELTPSSVTSVLSAAGLAPDGVVRWGELINSDEPGIYVVSSIDDVDAEGHEPRPAPIDEKAVARLLELRPELTMDGIRPNCTQLVKRLAEFWLPDEHIVYIGLASDLHNRVNQFYGTPLGARRPHAGGWFLKTLRNVEDLYVHWSKTYDRVTAEGAAIGAFVDRVSPQAKAQLRDPAHPFPFANLEWPPGTRKAHGIRGARAPRVRLPGTESGRRGEAAHPGRLAEVIGTVPTQTLGEGSGRTQRVTANDIATGQVRVPRRTKTIFPRDKAELDVVLRGTALRATWDPRLVPRERSGVIRVGRAALGSKVSEEEVLTVSINGSIYEIR